MLDEEKFEQYGFPRELTDIQGITLHESSSITDTAAGLFNWFNTENTSNIAYHYIVDSKEIIQLMPDDYVVYNTGKYRDWGDIHTIAIELCTTLNDEQFEATLANTVSLIKTLQNNYSIPDSMIFFHNTFNERIYCPKTLLNKYGNAKIFVMEELKGV